MYNLIPLVFILASLMIIIIIVVRKFSVLANVDIKTIQAEKEAVVKERIIGKRIKRNVYKNFSKLSRLAAPLGEALNSFFKWSYKKLLDFKENYNQDKVRGKEAEDSVDTIKKLFLDIDELIDKNDIEGAEKKYIDIIAIDAKNYKAFKNLGKLYFEQKKFEEAKQTLDHARRLLERNYEKKLNLTVENKGVNAEDIDDINPEEMLSSTYFDLSLVAKVEENFDQALEYIDKALKLEKNNPRYLDTKLELSIINKDKIKALEALDRLAKVNPENKKLQELKKQVDIL